MLRKPAGGAGDLLRWPAAEAGDLPRRLAAGEAVAAYSPRRLAVWTLEDRQPKLAAEREDSLRGPDFHLYVER